MPSRLLKPSSLPKSSRTQSNNNNNNSGISSSSNNNQVTLERVLGFTLSNNCALSLDCHSGNVAYIAGCVVVIRHLESDRQHFIQNTSKKPLTALEFSPDGKFIATGESGHQPMVRLWSVADGSQLAEYAGHHFRVVAVRFSPSTRYLVSLGSQEDNTLYVWDRASGQRVASAKVTNKVNGIAFSPTGQFFVTVGVRHVRYWYLEPRRTRHKETLPLNGRNAILGDLLNNSFMDVCCTLRVSDKLDTSMTGSSIDPAGSEDSVTDAVLTLIVSKAGQLMQFNDQRYLEKWVELRTSRASCLSTTGPWVIVGCACGTCLLFESETLQFLAQLPMPHSLGSDLQHNSPQTISVQPPTTLDSSDGPLFPDLLAIKLDWSRSTVVCFYADHSFYVWDIQELNNIRRRHSQFYHSRGVWSIDCFTEPLCPTISRTADSDAPPPANCMPSWCTSGAFVTCADDGTIRFWNLQDEEAQMNADGDESAASSLQDMSEWTASQCTEQLLRIIYTDPGHKFLCVSDRPSAGVGPLGGPPCSPTVLSSTGPNDSAAPSPSSPTVPGFGELPLPSQHTGCCVRAVCISPDCRHLAVGDRDGNLRVYAMETLTPVCQIPAHDKEILSLSFFRSDSVPELALLCSASRDRLIHIFDPNQNYSLVQTVADHSAAIFAARIVETEEDGEIRLISCGMDKSLLIRVLEPDDAGLTAHFALEHHLVGRHSQLDAAFTPNVCPITDSKSSHRRRYLAVACQDRRLRIYNITTGRPVRCYRGSFNEDGCLVRCAIDATGSIVVTSGSDKQLNLFHLLTGESIATLCGHSELALGLRFLSDMRHLVSVSSDSCVFVWRLAPGLSQHLAERAGRTIRTQSFTGFPLTTRSATGSLRPVAPLRWPRSFRTAGEEDESTTSWTETCGEGKRADLGEEESLLDLLQLDTNELLLSHDSLRESSFRDSHDSSDGDLLSADHASTDSSYLTAKSTCVVPQSRAAAKPTFYFSVSALPAWARRKLSRRSSVALVPSAIPQLAATHQRISNTESAADVSHVASGTSRSPESFSPRCTYGDTEKLHTFNTSPDRCSNDSLNFSQPDVDHASASEPAEHEQLMSTSDYAVSPVPMVSTRVTDSRRLKSRAPRSTSTNVSGNVSPRSSAPTTPFRRDRSWAQSDAGQRSFRLPKRHTISVSTGLQQQRVSLSLRSGSLRTRGVHVLHESISEIHSPKKATDMEDEDEDDHYNRSVTAQQTRSFERKSNWAAANRNSFFNSRSRGEAIQTSHQSAQTNFVPNRHVGIMETTINSSSIGKGHSRPSSMASMPSLRTASEQQVAASRPGFTPSERNAQPDSRSASFSNDLSSESLPAANNVPSSRSTTTAAAAMRSTATEPRLESVRDRFSSTTFASRQKFTLNDSAGKQNASRSSLTGGRLKKAVSSTSVQHSGLGHNAATHQEQESDRSERTAPKSSKFFTDDSGALTSPSRTSSHSLGRAVSQVQLTSPIGQRSSFANRARWLPSPTSPSHVNHDATTKSFTTSTRGKSTSRRPITSSARTPTSPAAVRPSDLSLATASLTASIRPSSSGNGNNPARGDQSEIVRPTDDLNPDSTQPQERQHTRIFQADSSSNSTLAEVDKFQTTREALETLQEAMELAVQRCSQFRDTENGSEEDLAVLRSIMTNELEWRFAQLRAMLGLSPICVEAPVARVLLADLVERLIPKLHVYSQPDGLPNPISPSGIEQKKAEVAAMVRQSSLNEWIADSTTEPAPTPVTTAPNKVIPDVEQEDDVGVDAFPDRVRWTLEGRTAVKEES